MEKQKNWQRFPTAEYCWMLHTPDDNYFFKTEKEAIEHSDSEISGYCDDGWDDAVESLFIAKVTHDCRQTNRRERPDESELNEELCDSEGTYWGEFKYICDYELKPLIPETP
ncbi:hypothetical protein [Hydrogenovibrio marinus]|uniref:Uncharacterized protein n=1 Tax=Hydrogenovibrio marinus TaxID=28885 RepID=A0A066ZX86_HYDMR|nr:hypothetical protein [Hydrogenovibrio marinus]KDN94670.1 hypothetical protein EI16_12285 [Hydrogenovibrio marinus]